jgi:hypothetical protein
VEAWPRRYKFTPLENRRVGWNFLTQHCEYVSRAGRWRIATDQATRGGQSRMPQLMKSIEFGLRACLLRAVHSHQFFCIKNGEVMRIVNPLIAVHAVGSVSSQIDQPLPGNRGNCYF